MKYTNMVGQVLVCVYFKAFQITYSVTISGSGSYIIPNTYYELTCSYDTFKKDRRTLYDFLDEKSNRIHSVSIRYENTSGLCYYRNPEYVPCADDVCSCDRDGMATQIFYNHTSNITGCITMNCFSGITSIIKIPVAVGPGDSMVFIPPSTHDIKTLGESLGPVTCSAVCQPECQYEWTMQSGTITRGSTLNKLSLTKDDDGIYSCKAWNDVYASGKTMEFNLTVNYGPESVSILPLNTTYTVTEGNDILSISCMADCKPACDYTWSGPNVPAGTDNVLILLNIRKNQRGVFNCAASNYLGSLNSSDVDIDVLFGPKSSMQFEPSITALSKKKGDTLGPINCAATCNPPCQYKWTKPDKTVIIAAQLMLSSLSIEDHGQFTCTASNVIGSSVNKSLDVIVNYGPMAVILLPPTQQYTVENGDTIPPINCSAKCRPDCKNMWSGPNVASDLFNVLSLHTIQKNQSGEYQCRASNEVGSMQSSIINVTVQFGPGSSLQFYPSNTSVTKKKGDTLGPIECRATCHPPCQYKWTKPDKTIINDRELTIESLSTDDHGTFICTASNRLGDGNIKLDVTVNYGPVAVILSPSTKQYIVTYGQTIAPINCSANCRPECTHMWSGRNVSYDAANSLHLQHIQKNQSGDFQCRAFNEVSSKQSDIINVNVQYAPFVNNVSINGSNFTVRENTTAILSCNFEGNPAPRSTWEKNNKILSDEDEINERSSYTIQPVRCEDNGNYSCVANNSLGKSSAQQSLFVTCSPRLNFQVEQPSTKIGLSTGADLSLAVNLIAYPTPTSTLWFFKDTEGNETNITSNLKTFELFKHVTVLSKTNLTKYDFGDYILKVNNTLGASIQTYHVIPQGPPDPTFILNVSCGVLTAKLYWLSSFNGGDIQHFSIIVQKKEKDIYLHETDINDEDGKNIKFESIKLSAGEYIFQIYGNNKYGNRTSTNSKLCQVKDVIRSVFDSVIIVAAGGGTAVFVTVAIVLVVLLKKRRSFKGGDKEMIKRCSRTTNEDEDGLKDNPLYVTSGEVSNGDVGSVYGIVNKQKQNKDPLLSDEETDEGPVYSQVQKSNIKGKKKQKKNKLNKASMNENNTDIELGTVYENSEKLFKQTNSDEIYANAAEHDDGANSSKAYSPRKNKDGLIYADVDLLPGPSGKRFVIRGLENRTNYAIIDLSKKADPLPSDNEDEDEDKNYANVEPYNNECKG